MPATVSNKSINTASVTNKAVQAQSGNQTWDDMTHTFDEERGTWNQPRKLSNKSINTASVTNKAVS